MKRVDTKRYCQITNCGPWLNLNHFDIDEVQDFLNGLGYDIIEHEAKGMVQDQESDPGGEVNNIGKPYLAKVDDILAIKPGTIIPENLSTPEGQAMRLSVVFQKELKNKILGKVIITSINQLQL